MHDIGRGNEKISIKRKRKLTKEIVKTPKVGTNVTTDRLNMFLCV